MSDLVTNPLTEIQIQSFINSPSHALILIGPVGSAKFDLAKSLSETILDIGDDKLDDYAYKLIIGNDEGSIGIESIRQFEHFLSLKVPRDTNFNRIVIIKNAQTLTLEAQNALLKTLEEPPVGTLLILTATHSQALLPTISSRAQLINVKRPSIDMLNKYFEKQGHTSDQIKQAYAISGGLPGLMQALLNKHEEHPLILATEKARQFLKATGYERLLLVDELAKQRELALDTVFILQQMAHLALQTSHGQTAKRWTAVMSAAFNTTNQLNESAQPKLALTNLALSF